MGKGIVFLPLLFLVASVSAQEFQLEEFSSGYSSPLEVTNCGDSRLFVVQKSGYIYICDSAGIKNPTPFLDIHTKVKTTSERGLLGLAFHPDYFNNGYFFIFYSPKGTDTNVIARYKVDALNPDLADTGSEKIVIKIPHPTYDNHDGGCLRFGKDGYLYAGTGDGGDAWDPFNNGQNRKSFLGKLLRLDIDVDSGYTIPPDNPFVNNATFSPEIWALGLRNPWRFSFDRVTQDFWIGDVGQGTWEEVDLINAIDTGGQNYGWDCYEGNVANETQHCDTAGDLTWPIYVYQHLNGDCSITGGFVYRGAQFKNFYGKYFFVDYCSSNFRSMESDGNGGWITSMVLDNSTSYNFVSFGEDVNGELYAVAYSEGKIYHITDTACSPVAQIIIDNGDGVLDFNSVACNPVSLQTAFGKGLTYQWFANGNEIFGATSNIFQPISNDSINYSVVVTNSSGCSTTSSTVLNAGNLEPAAIIGLDSFYCIDQTSDTLTAEPAGGTFSGDGINGNIFSPAVAGAGTHSISYSYTNSYQCPVTTTVQTVVDLCSGIFGNNESEMIIYPNPTRGIVRIVLKDSSNMNSEISVCNLAGQEVFKTKTQIMQSKQITLDLSSLADGMYSLHLVSGNQNHLKKIVIQH